MKVVIWIAGIVIVLAAILITGYVIVEKKIFAMLTDQPGARIEFSGKSGSLFSGYTITDFYMEQTETRNDVPPTKFTTPRLTIHWKLNPIEVTEISWDGGNLTLMLGDDLEDIRIGEGSLLPGEYGWLESVSEIEIGPDSWDGTLDLKIRQKIDEIKAEVNFENLPSRLIAIFSDPPPGFILPRNVVLEMNMDGPPGNLEAHGTVSDPNSRRSYRF